MFADEGEAEGAENQENQDPASQGAAASADKPARKPIKLTFEEYKQISHMFVFYMRRQEEEADGELVQRALMYSMLPAYRLPSLSCISLSIPVPIYLLDLPFVW